MISPYKNKNKDEWKAITEQLVEDYPLKTEDILEIALTAWDNLWSTKVANIIKLSEVELPATVIGYFFQKLYTHELSNRYPEKWRGEKEKSDKDIVYIEDIKYSTEMKSSGQLGYKVFGNRSYCQGSNTPSKAKSGYYITVNFYKTTLTLISIGWIDKEDWNCQNAESGQAATLPLEVYKGKLIKIIGKYQLNSPIGILDGIGEVTEKKLNELEVYTFKDVLEKYESNKIIKKVFQNNEELLTALINYL